jgi:hypothetical protein
MPRTDESWNTTAGVGATTGYCRGGLQPIVRAGCWIGMWAKPGPSALRRQLPTPVTIRGIGFYPDFSDESVILTGVCGPRNAADIAMFTQLVAVEADGRANLQ